MIFANLRQRYVLFVGIPRLLFAVRRLLQTFFHA
jgi:hypothetical protein